MVEPVKDDVGTTGDELVDSERAGTSGDGQSPANSSAKAGNADNKDETASSKGTIAGGTGDENLAQASGGSVD
jgi:hypothetical protein